MNIESAKDVATEVTPIVQQYGQELLSWVQSSKNFMTEQAPLLVQEILYYGMASSCLWSFLWLVLLCLGVWGTRLNYKQIQGEYYLVQFILCLFGSIAVALFFVMSMTTTVKIYFAPRLYLIEYLSSLIK